MDVKIVFILAPLASFCLSSFLIEFASIFTKSKQLNIKMINSAVSR